MSEGILLDSSYIFAVYDNQDNNHTEARKFAKTNSLLVLVPLTLNEVFFLIDRRGGVPATTVFLKQFV